MKKIALATLLLLPALLSSCATSHAVRYAYGHESVFAEAEEDDVWRAVYGGPVILGSVAFDLATFPAQAIFGVWPIWGAGSLSMRPGADDDN